MNIEKLCNEYNIKNYTINSDLLVDVDDDVVLSSMNLSNIPIKFGNVTGSFYCYDNKLVNLLYSPEQVDMNFWCGHNKLTSLEGCPEYVGGNFSCSDNKLTTLEHCPNYVGGNFSCYSNKLTVLDYYPKYVGGDFYCDLNMFTTRQNIFLLNIKSSIISDCLWKF